jgi:integrase
MVTEYNYSISVAYLHKGVSMATIEERTSKSGETTYRVKIRLKGEKPQEATFKRKSDAKKWAGSIEAAIREGRHFRCVEAKRRTLAELIDKYIDNVLPHKSESMQSAQRNQLLWWKEKSGYSLLADFTPQIIGKLREELSKGTTNRGKKRTTATVNRYLAALSHVLSTAVNEYEWLETNPLLKIKRQPESQGRVRYLDDDERGRLLSACKQSSNQQLYAIVVLALSTGMRKGEILNLKRRDVFLNEGFVVLDKTKNKERRRVPIISHAYEVLSYQLKIARLDTDYVFPSKDGKKPIDIKRPWEVAVLNAQLDDFRFHDLRHSCASYLAMNGASQRDLMEVLGHKTVQMTKRYSHLSDSHISSVVGSMNEKIFGGVE